MTVSVLTPAIPSRIVKLAEAVESVARQTVKPVEHLIRMDYERAGCAETQNRLLAATSGEWVSLLADDDRLLPWHLETLLAHTDGADVVYGDCRVVGREGFRPGGPFDPEKLRHGNYIPSTCLIRTGLVRDLGGWRTGAANGWEDWDLWLRALDAGATFRYVPETTWIYVFHGGNATWHGMAAAS